MLFDFNFLNNSPATDSEQYWKVSTNEKMKKMKSRETLKNHKDDIDIGI